MLLQIQSLHLPTLCFNPSYPRYIRFKPSHRLNLRYLTSLGIVSGRGRRPSPETLQNLLAVVDFLKSKGFSETHFPRLSFLCPQIFSSDLHDLDAVFTFLAQDLAASPEESRLLVHRCPEILLSSVEFRLRPTVEFLREVGLQKLRSPSTLNAYLLNTPVEKLVEKVRFLESLGFSAEEAARVCARLPAVFGYSVENNLMPKVVYLAREMERSLEELKAFPQYFAFSLQKRIVPRHVHLKARQVRVPLQSMLVCGDEKFYAKWK